MRPNDYRTLRGGGARFDPGMLYYSPQIWCSDDTDAIERLKIQHGTSMCYPCSAMGAHVSDCPNHTVGRNTPFKTRGHVAMVGTFGYELDVTRIPQEDRDAIPAQIEEFNKFNKLVRTGDHYRIGNMLQRTRAKHSLSSFRCLADQTKDQDVSSSKVLKLTLTIMRRMSLTKRFQVRHS